MVQKVDMVVVGALRWKAGTLSFTESAEEVVVVLSELRPAFGAFGGERVIDKEA